MKDYVDKYPRRSTRRWIRMGSQPAVGTTRPTAPFQSATQNEINAVDASNLVDNGVVVVSEGANMPTVPEGIDIFIENGCSMARARRPMPAGCRYRAWR
jgi:glutamate dehydrogenase (NADP+)